MFAKRTQAEIREYVERELDRTSRANHPDMEVVAGSRWTEASTARGQRQLLWTIMDPADRARDYVVEARVKEGELLIWFGYSSAGGLSTHHLMRLAVHLSMQELGFATDQYRAEAFSLGAVLERMLQSREQHAVTCFPMNHHTLT
ncbi:MAG: hypothetical protein ACE1ZF_04305 [Gemmatimonadales bacterium]